MGWILRSILELVDNISKAVCRPTANSLDPMPVTHWGQCLRVTLGWGRIPWNCSAKVHLATPESTNRVHKGFIEKLSFDQNATLNASLDCNAALRGSRTFKQSMAHCSRN